MQENIKISGFSDEISPDFTKQLETVTALGMHYICLRSADYKNIVDYTVNEAKEKLLPKLKKFGVKVSLIGSPIGKVAVVSKEGFEKHLKSLENLCRIGNLLDCPNIRIFSFYIPKGKDPENYRKIVLEKLAEFKDVAEKYGAVLLHENEKFIYGNTGKRCKILFECLASPHFLGVFDFANFVQCAEDTSACWELLQPYIRDIHVKDALFKNKENVLFGSGDGNAKELIKLAFAKGNFKGFLTLEPHLYGFDIFLPPETEFTDNTVIKNKVKNGAEGYAMQYDALLKILEAI